MTSKVSKPQARIACASSSNASIESMKKGKGHSKGQEASSKPAAGSSSRKAVSLALDIEDEVKKLLQDLGNQTTQSESATASADSKKTAKQYASVFDGLLSHGFTQQQVELVLRALPMGSVRMDTALDWLCLNLPPSQLPRRFAGAAKSATRDAQVRIVSTSKARGQSRAPAAYDPAPDLPSYTSSEHETDSEAEEQATMCSPPQTSGKTTAEDDAAAAKAWIRQQYLAGGDEGSEEEEETASSAGSIDDWELWADPREVARRKQERARARIPPEVRCREVAHELVKTKALAAAAKASGDKAKQQAAGAIIRELKSEMDQLGLTEARAAEIVAEDQAAQGGGADDAGDTAVEFDPDSLDLFGDSGGVVGTQQESGMQESSAEGPQRPQDVAQGSGDKSREPGPEAEPEAVVADDWMAHFDLFDSDAAAGVPAGEGGGTGVAAKTAAAATPEPLVPWGSEGTQKGRKVAGGGAGPRGKPPAGSAAPTLEPRALLSQQCQKNGWPQPRFEKLHDAVGGRAGRVCYSTTVSMGATRGAQAKRRGWSGTKVFQLHPEEDGWDNVKDAQNAAATRALYELFGSEFPLHHQLGPPYKDLWLQWESEGQNTRQQDQETQQQQREEFVQALLAERQQQAQTGAATPQQPPTPADDDDTAAEEWEARADLEETATIATTSLAEMESLTPPTITATLTAAQEHESKVMSNKLSQWRTSDQGAAMLEKRATLPIHAIRAQLLGALAAHDVVLVCGDTGCGKTTQVPQYILEDLTEQGRGAVAQVVCTQPRRIAAISVACRVAVERGEPEPGRGGAGTVAYQVRLDSTVTQHTKLTFCTTGILMRRLAGDRDLLSVTHVIVDEVHERSMQGDFLLALLKVLVTRRRALRNPLKVILMSATLDADTFSQYMGGCPVLTAEGRTFPVQSLYLEDVYDVTQYKLGLDAQAAHRATGARAAAQAMRHQAGGGNRDKQALLASGWGDELSDVGPLNPLYDSALYSGYNEVVRRNLSRVNEEVLDYDLLEELVTFIHETQPEGAILVFLPGVGEISQVYQRLTSTRTFGRHGTARVHVLHSGVSPEEQRAVFPVPPPGVRKVVLATNIAETSLTIEDVVYVVDTGRHKERRYDPSRRMSLLVLDWVSRASALQRRGRAGRVRPGQCYCLYTKQRFEHHLRAFGAPEMVRVPLEELVLQIHALHLGPAARFLASVLEPPPAKSVTGALVTLQQVGALDMAEDREELTALGEHLANLPVEPRLGKLLVLSALLGCLSPAATMAACLSHKSPFTTPSTQDKRDSVEAVRKALADKGSGNIASGQQSDHLLLVAAFNTWLSALTGKSSVGAQPAAHKGKAGKDKPHVQGAKDASKVVQKLSLNEKVLQELQEMRVQLAGLLVDAGLVPRPSHSSAAQQSSGGGPRHLQDAAWLDDMTAPWNRYAQQACVVKAVLCAALSPNVASMSEQSPSHSPPSWLTPVGVAQPTQGGSCPTEEVSLHPSCVAYGVRTSDMAQPYVVYLEKVKTGRAYLRDVTPVSPVSLLLFGGPLTVLHTQGLVLVDGWIQVRAAAQTAVVVRGLRTALDKLLQHMVRSPGQSVSGPHAEVIPTLVKLLQDDERPVC